MHHHTIWLDFVAILWPRLSSLSSRLPTPAPTSFFRWISVLLLPVTSLLLVFFYLCNDDGTSSSPGQITTPSSTSKPRCSHMSATALGPCQAIQKFE
jgi:hypothetical protein